MFDDDALARPAKDLPLELQIENASIADLKARIERLRAEISLCEKSIAAKTAQRAAADSVFGARPS